MNDLNETPRYLRWTKAERVQHWILAGSFTLLAITGFALRYPEAAWARPILMFEDSFDLRGLLHRLAAVAFTALAVYHVAYMLLARRGRMLLAALLIRREDLADLRENLRFFSGRRKEPVSFGHFSYMEKVEYWALIWGSVVMGTTGFFLWFEGFALRIFPLWMIEVFTVIHLYEAWLATLAIFVWHFYGVILNPEVYPLNTSMIDGTLPESVMEKEHGRELERLRTAEVAFSLADDETLTKPGRPKVTPAEKYSGEQ